MSINQFILNTKDTCAMVKDQLHPEINSSSLDSVDRIGRYITGIADGAFYFNYLSVELGMTQAHATISFALVAAGDTVTIGDQVYTGSNSPTGPNQFQTNVTPSIAADKVAAASLAAVVNLNPTS